jgi:hypothetical protein
MNPEIVFTILFGFLAVVMALIALFLLWDTNREVHRISANLGLVDSMLEDLGEGE